MRASGGFAALLIDTHVILWMAADHRRLSPTFRERLRDGTLPLQVSAVIAFEFSDLQSHGRLPIKEPLAEILPRFDFEVVDFPAEAWKVSNQLPRIHRDPIDRMLVAHAIAVNDTIVTADCDIARYPVSVLW